MKPTQKKKKCKGCGIKFIARSGHQIYCSQECREKECKKRCAKRYQKRKAEKKGLSYGQYMILLQIEKDREERVKIS